jgi:pimeloyl-ACP methyl ester carboxylesterase/membrane protein YqaA with SNARE-associated domain
MHELSLSPLLLCVLVVVVSATSSLFPVSPVEPWLIGVATVAPGWLIAPLIVLVTVSSMSAKTLVFLSGRRVESSFKGRTRERFERLRVRVADRPKLQRGTLFLSSLFGFPPFYVITALCGSLRMPLRHFVILATTGRAIRFAALMLAPQLFKARVAHAQTLPPAVRVAGTGPQTYVLLSGLVGGVGGFRRLETRLVNAGNRVVTIDPYQLAIDSTVVSFDAMARMVDAELHARGITDAIIVGHSHGGGVALRLAANVPKRAAALYLLDVGALPSNRTTVFSSAVRLVPIIARIPTGKMLIRHRLADGLRENSASREWLDHATCRGYTEPLIDNVDRIVAMALRLAKADEPEPVEQVVRRIAVPITVLLGGVRTKSGPSDDELRALAQLAARVRIETIPGAGHFPHEEAPDEVLRRIARPLVTLTTTLP